jgi:hypothetical protein
MLVTALIEGWSRQCIGLPVAGSFGIGIRANEKGPLTRSFFPRTGI